MISTKKLFVLTYFVTVSTLTLIQIGLVTPVTTQMLPIINDHILILLELRLQII